MEFNNDEYPIIQINKQGRLIKSNQKFNKLLDKERLDVCQFQVELSNKNQEPKHAQLIIESATYDCLLHPVIINNNESAFIFSLLPVSLSPSYQKTEELQTSSLNYKNFALIAAHDLNEPFRTIENFLSLYKESINFELTEESQLYLNMVEQAAGRMRALLAGILQYYKLEATQKDNIAINTLLDEIESDLKLQIDASKAEIVRKNILDIHADRNMAYLLFKNLISNAIKFKLKEESPKIEIESTLVEGFVEYRIKDNGMGISEENLETIFNMFKRLNPKGEYEGAGIGLALCKNIVQEHGGKIRVESDQSQGSTFIFTMPHSIN